MPLLRRRTAIVAPRRRTGWEPGPAISQAFSTSVVALGATAIASSTDGLTVARIRGNVLAYLTSAAGGTAEGFRFGVGIAVFNPEAIAVGVTALPGPLTDAGSDEWMWHQIFNVRSRATFSTTDPAGLFRCEIDGRAMRRVDEDRVLAIVVESVEVGTATAQVEVDTRVLIKQP